MNKYVVGFLSLHGGELRLEEVCARSKLEAAFSYLQYEEGDKEGIKTFDDLVNNIANQDGYINVLQLNNSRAGRPGGSLQNCVAELDSQAGFH